MPDDLSLDSSTDDVGREVLALKIRLLFSHPTIDPAVITNAIGVQPCMQLRAGDPVTGLDGKPRRGIEKQSAWAVWRRYDGDPDIGECLGDFVNLLQPHNVFVRHLASECYAAMLIFSYSSNLYFGGSIASSRLQSIADLGLSLGIEIYPDPQITSE